MILHLCPWRSGTDGSLSFVGARPSNCIFFFFSLLLLQCNFNINLMPYSVSPTFFTPYDVQASSACSALIKYRLLLYTNMDDMCLWWWLVCFCFPTECHRWKLGLNGVSFREFSCILNVQNKTLPGDLILSHHNRRSRTCDCFLFSPWSFKEPET